jgi:hypothetical protein
VARLPRENGKPASQLIYWIAALAAGHRIETGMSPEKMSQLTGINAMLLRRFERGEAWPVDLDSILAAYAQIAELEDGRHIVVQAVDAWLTHDEALVPA